MKVTLPADLAIDAEVDLGTTGGAYFLQARLNVTENGHVRTVYGVQSLPIGTPVTVEVIFEIK